MKDGFIKIGAAVPEIKIGDCDYNADRIIEQIKLAYEAGVRLLVLPELCVAGCSCKDLFMHSKLLNSVEKALRKIAAATGELDIVYAVGAPLRIGGKVCNCAAVYTRNNEIGIVTKEHLTPQESCWFSSERRSILFKGADFPDLNFEVCIGDDKPRTGAGIVLRMKAESETVGKDGYGKAEASVLSYQHHCILVSVNAGEGESTAGSVYSGRRMIYENGKPLAVSSLFGYGSEYADADAAFIAYERRRCGFVPASADETVELAFGSQDTKLTRRFSPLPFVPEDKKALAERCERVIEIQSRGLLKRVKHTGAQKLVIGISGGLDSTLALLVCVKTAGLCDMAHSDVIAVTMPCFGTTTRTKGNAEKLAELLGVTLRTVDITEAVKLHFRNIDHDPELHNAAFENAQARERTQVLMDIANDVNGLVVGTGDLSELALGWATYGGDHLSMYGVNAGVPKTLIQRIVAHCAETSGSAELAAVLRDIVDTPISPELLPDQKTEDSVGPYELHDFFIYHMIRRGSSPAKIYRIASEAFAGKYGDETIKKWLRVFCRRFFSQQFKRSCSPDSVKIGSVSLSPDDLWLPSDICGDLWIKEADEL